MSLAQKLKPGVEKRTFSASRFFRAGIKNAIPT